MDLMDGKYLLEKMELIDPVYIEAAEKKPCKKIVIWPYYAAMAACIAVMIFSGYDLFTTQYEGISPVAVINSASIFGDGSVALLLFISAALVTAALAAVIIQRRKQK
jgi:TRAP-type C4-dicarboxylate transport system permease small subunit